MILGQLGVMNDPLSLTRTQMGHIVSLTSPNTNSSPHTDLTNWTPARPDHQHQLLTGSARNFRLRDIRICTPRIPDIGRVSLQILHQREERAVRWPQGSPDMFLLTGLQRTAPPSDEKILLNLFFGGSQSTVVALSRSLIGRLSANQPMGGGAGRGIFPQPGSLHK